jgi:hypothetical protein
MLYIEVMGHWRSFEQRGECWYVDLPDPPEDVEWVGNIAVMSTCNYINLALNDIDTDICSLYTFDLRTNYTEAVEIQDFPESVDFHPIGINLFNNDTLFVVN